MSLPESQAKKSGGELLSVNELFDTSPTKAFFTELCAVCVVEWVSLKSGQVKNYGIWLRYDSRTNTHNMYKDNVSPLVFGCLLEHGRSNLGP